MAASSTGRWVVFHHTRAQVPTVEARLAGLEVHLFGLPEGFTREEVEGWIGSLAAASREGAVAASPDDPIPPVLRHVLGGLLFSHAELWGRSATTPFSIVLVHEHGRVAFGWVGHAAVRVHVAGREVAPEWVSVRDHQGRESHAWRGDAREDLRLELFCAAGSGADAAAIQLEIEWAGTAREPVKAAPTTSTRTSPGHEARVTLEPTDVFLIDDLEPADTEATVMLEIEALEPLESVNESDRVATPREAVGSVPAPSIAEPDAPTGAASGPILSADEVMPLEERTSEEPPSSGVARWLAQALGWRKKPTATQEAEDRPAAAVVPLEEDRAQPAEQPAVVAYDIASTATLLNTESELVVSSAAVAPEPEMTSESLELPPEVPARIPPTPEAPEVTARTVQVFSTLDDPHTIALPGAATPDPVPTQAVPTLSIPAAPASMETELRVVDLPPVSAPVSAPQHSADDSIPAGALFASPPAPTRADPVPFGLTADHREPIAPTSPRRAARRPSWPALPVPPGGMPKDWRPWAVGVGIVLVLFGAGWMLGSSQGGSDHKPSPVMGFLRSIGLAGARFETIITSQPEGAAITVDGKDTGRLTPATLELPPGEHRVDLSFPDLGAASYLVNGARGEKVPLEATLWGSVDVTVSDATTPIAVAVDGQARGFAPLQIDSLAPGPHDLRFTGPGMASWGTTVEVRVGEVREVLAYPLQSPATGLLQIRATITQDGESQSLPGARVVIDGDSRGLTPLTLELPRGPHSVRVSYQKETAPVQVIDLPGGNQRFATFEFGLEAESPAITLRAPAQMPASDEPVLISATLGQVAARDVREMWLHVRTADDRWRRYPMTLIDAQGSAVGAAPFPAAAVGSGGTRYYVSALTSQGDEYFTEMQSIGRRAR